jgi:uncharacterized protein YjbJ (UPF0337 family)
MNWEQIEGHWKEMKGQAHEKWGKLTDDDLARIDGRRMQLVGVVQQRYGKAKEVAEREVDAWMDGLTRSTDSPPTTSAPTR